MNLARIYKQGSMLIQGFWRRSSAVDELTDVINIGFYKTYGNPLFTSFTPDSENLLTTLSRTYVSIFLNRKDTFFDFVIKVIQYYCISYYEINLVNPWHVVIRHASLMMMAGVEASRLQSTLISLTAHYEVSWLINKHQTPTMLEPLYTLFCSKTCLVPL